MTWRRLVIVGHDALVTLAALFVSFALRWGWTEFAARLPSITAVCLAAWPLALVAYWVVRTDRTPWKYVSLSDLTKLAGAAAVPAVFLALVDFLSRGAVVVPRSVPVIYWLVQLAALAGPRILYRIHRARRQERRAFAGQHRVPVVIAGTGDEADALITRLRRDAVSRLEPVALLAAKPRHVGDRIQQVPILGQVGDLVSVVEALGRRGVKPRRLIVTRELFRDGTGLDGLIGAAERLGLAAVRTAQPVASLGDAAEPIKLAPVSIDDLLGRSSRDLDMAPVRALLAGRRVAVTGAGGSIGSELCRQAAGMGAAALLLFEQSELALWSIAREVRAAHPALPVTLALGSVVEPADLADAFGAFGPEVVFHAAALKHVDIVEAHPVAAAATNTLGTEAVARATVAGGAVCGVFISTDKAVDPVSVLGATKRAGERLWGLRDREARSAGRPTRLVTVRFGNVLGSSGSVIPLFTEQLRAGGPLTVTHPDVERFFMTIPEAVRLVLAASALGVAAEEDGPAFVLDMGEPVRILDLAHRMIRLAGLEPGNDIAVTFTGLRPGERLTELLESATEKLSPTAVPGLRRSASPEGDAAGIEAALARLSEAIARHAAGDVRAVLRVLAPDYREAATAPAAQASERPSA